MNTDTCIDEPRYWCCDAIGCDNLASIVVDSRPERFEAYCGLHWVELRPPSVLGVLVLPDRPDCFRATCQTPAVSLRTHTDGSRLPVCETHLDDLSCVNPTESELLELKLR